MADFALHPQLENDSMHIADLKLCNVRLAKDARFPWLILIPRRPDLRDWHNVAPADQMDLLAEVNTASGILEQRFTADKINVAALGNQVPQLHIHVIARFTTDSAWPGPVWGVGIPSSYDEADLQLLLVELRTAFNVS